MRPYVIMTDNCADLPESYYKEHGISVNYLNYTLNGKTYEPDEFLPEKEYYKLLREGSLPTTSQATPAQVKDHMESLLKEGKDILCLAFSSGLSGTYGSCVAAADELKTEYPEQKIIVIDTLCASLGQGLLVHYAVQHKEAGEDIATVAYWVETHKLNLVHLFTVDDLFHLHRGGRVSKTTAVVGSMLNIKPVLHVDNEGHLINIGKARGRKKSLLELVRLMEEQIGSYKESIDTIFISHGDCIEDAEFVRDKVKEKFPIKTCLINYVGSVIGTHSGPGTLALFFLGDVR